MFVAAIAVFFIVSTAPAPEQPWLAPWLGLPLFGLLLLIFFFFAEKIFRPHLSISSKQYFAAEKKASILATVLFIASFIAFDLKYYAEPLSFNDTLPTLPNLLGLLLFFCFLSLMWLRALPSYRRIFNSVVTPADFVLNNIKANLTLVLPWLILSFFYDLLKTLPVSVGERWTRTFWGESLYLLLFFLLLSVLFPPVISRLWGCVPMESRPLRQRIEQFFSSQNFSAGDPTYCNSFDAFDC